MVQTPDGWVSLRDYVERLIHDHERAQTAQLDAAEKALKLASETMGVRLEHLNNFRKQLEDERMKYVREERFQAVLDRLRMVEEHDAGRAGKQTVVVTMTTVVAALLATVLTLLIRHMLP